METENIIAPFVLKTYQMVNDHTTDSVISWGRGNNSFIVIHLLDFSQSLLPAYFKHSNFSSFVRQLNTYGFRKVDPDRWEFASEWFLPGQTHLLKNIVRRKQSKNNHTTQNKLEDDEDEGMVMEIERLKQEQKAFEQELEGMNKRLEATERRPKQMMAFLSKVAKDPEILPRMMLQKERTRKLGEKRRRLNLPQTSSVKSEKEEEIIAVNGASPISSPDSNFDMSNYFPSSSSPETPSTAWPADSVAGYGNLSGRDLGNFGVVMAGIETSPPPYPFSLLGGGF